MVQKENKIKIFAIVPAYQEEKTIAQVVRSLKEKVDEVVVVVDGKVDRTGEIAESNGAIVLYHLVNRGQGAALETGDQYALENGADIVVHFDADGQHQAEDVETLISPLIKGEVDVVFGSRFLKGKSFVPWTKKWLILKPATILNNFLTGLKLTDAHNGLRALNKFALRKIRITQDRMSHNTEIASLVKHHHLRYKEVPVRIIYKKYGQGYLAGFKILKELFFDRFFR